MIVSKRDHQIWQASAIHRVCVTAILEYRKLVIRFLSERHKALCLFDEINLLRFCQSHDMKRHFDVIFFGWFPVKVIPSTSNVRCVMIEAWWR